MTDRPVVPHGAWPSPITATSLVAGSVRIGEVRVDGDDLWWSEQRPTEGGRTQLVRRTPDGACHDLFPAPDPDAGVRAWDVRSRAGEYGGGAWAVDRGTAVFADGADQRLHRAVPGSPPEPLAATPEPAVRFGLRYRDPTPWGDGWVVCERETHEPDVVADHGEARTDLVAVPTAGGAPPVVLADGPDFASSPAADPTDGTRLAWITWDHPRMPWDGTELHVGRWAREPDGTPADRLEHRVVAGGPDESIVQPGFLADGTLVWCTDRRGWWTPWCLRPGAAEPEPMLDGEPEVEIGGPLWVGGLRWWTELSPGLLLVVARSAGRDRLALVERDRTLRILDTPFTEISQVVAVGDGRSAVIVAGSPTSEPLPIRVTVDAAGSAAHEVLRSTPDGLEAAWISVPTPITFASDDGGEAHGLLYPPTNPDVEAPAGTRPPLVVMIHGGPTSHARHVFSPAKQYWTSRGFAVVDVDHGGSTGYGRPFRRRLDGRWGELDVADAAAAARHLAAEGHVDADRLLIRGGSAGGFTTLAALCFGHTFAAGASHYGIADLSALAAETHKFESRYLDGLVGPWPEARATYEARSPIHHVDGFDRPLIVLQGAEDEVVPPDQAEMIVAALAAAGVPHAYVLFEGEGHGFRRAESIVRALEAELWFYGRVLGFEPADRIEPVEGAVGLG